MRATMTRALKMTALRIADLGRREMHDVQTLEHREGAGEHRRDDGEVLGDIVGDRESRKRSTGDQQLLADLHDLDELGGVGVQVDHVAGLLAACVPEFMATPTSAWASAGASFVPSPVMATDAPSGLVLADDAHLVLGRRLGHEVVHAGLLGDGARSAAGCRR